MFVVKICHDGQLLSFLNSYFVNGYQPEHLKHGGTSVRRKDTLCFPEYQPAR